MDTPHHCCFNVPICGLHVQREDTTPGKCWWEGHERRYNAEGDTGPILIFFLQMINSRCKVQASALAAGAVSVREWKKFPILPLGSAVTLGIVLDRRKNGGNGTVKNGYFVPFCLSFLLCWKLFLLFPSRYADDCPFPAIRPPSRSPVPHNFPHFSRTPNPGLVSPVAVVSVDVC